MKSNILFSGFFLLLGFLALLSVKAQSPVAEISVNAGNHLRINTPVSIDINKKFFKENQIPILKCVTDRSGKEINCQLETGTPGKLWWIISDTLQPGEIRTYNLYSEQNRIPQFVKTIKNEKAVIIFLDDKEVLQYNYATIYPPNGVDTIYKRSGFIHPLWSPSGTVLTRIQPPDHYHHYGIWNPWTKTQFEDREIDFWNLSKGVGTVEHTDFSSLSSGTVFGGFNAELVHVDLSAPEGRKIALNEVWDVKVWGIEGIWLWDFNSTLKCATDSPFIIEKYRYAGFGFRATEDWTNKNSYIVTSDGKTRKDADGSRGRWCNVFGELENGQAGIVFMSNPKNHSYPEPMRIWPENANGGRGDVFFNFCPTKESDWELKPGNSYSLKYRMLVYDGNITSETAERYWQDFAHPPTVEIKLLKTP